MIDQKNKHEKKQNDNSRIFDFFSLNLLRIGTSENSQELFVIRARNNQNIQYFIKIFYERQQKRYIFKEVKEKADFLKAKYSELSLKNLLDCYGNEHTFKFYEVILGQRGFQKKKGEIVDFQEFNSCIKNNFSIFFFTILFNPNLQDIICFNEQGSAFIVKDQVKLSQEILPITFKHQNFSSFIRQLNMYGFKKIRNVNNQNEFSHQYFRRGCESLMQNIIRRNGTIEKTKQRAEKKQHTTDQLDLIKKYSQMKDEIKYINQEVSYFCQQFQNFQTSLTTLTESTHFLFLELNQIKNKNQNYNELLYAMMIKFATHQPNNNFSKQQYSMGQGTTLSNRSSDNNENNGNSSKEGTNDYSPDTNASNQQIEVEEKHKDN
ncbi:hypothetical protein pb186bvf_014762 [Paramecium bursaria]